MTRKTTDVLLGHLLKRVSSYMRFCRLLVTSGFLAISLLAEPCHADTFVYSVANHFAGFQVDGTITTDLNMGTLSFANILDFQLLVSAAAKSELLTTANSENSTVYGSALTATAEGLFFDYEEPFSGLLFGNQTTGTYLCYQTYGCDSGFDSHQSIGLGGNSYLESQAGRIQIATAIAPTPEPSSLLLLGTGAIAATGAGRRRQPVH